MLCAQALQRTHLNTHQVFVEHAHQNIGGTGRIGQRAQDVEDGAYAQFLAHRGHILHCRMVIGREHETNAHIADAIGNLRGVQVDIDAQRLHRVGAARLAADAAATMLANLAARRRNHKGGAGGDIEGVGPIAARAHDVDQVRLVMHVHLVGELAHHFGSRRDFTNRFLLHAQPGEDGRRHDGRQLTAHDHAHQVQHFVVEDFAVFDRALQRFLGSNHCRISLCFWEPLACVFDGVLMVFYSIRIKYMD